MRLEGLNFGGDFLGYFGWDCWLGDKDYEGLQRSEVFDE